MSDALTLGVIGHVDHGKTALVRALTGTETDRLKEERERGLSIVLGFAFLETADGVVDLIDVPGHEDFIRAMISGATALDGIVLCVAANEGVKPQTVEHFNIAKLLGIGQGLVVVTKTDLVDTETLALLRQELDDFLEGSFLEVAPRIETSVESGTGINDVRATISEIAATPVERDTRGRCFLPLDRVFTMRGFGLVGTGTLRGGELKTGATVEILPGGKSATVRALQNHGQSVECIAPGQRAAVNLRHVDREQVQRGDVLATPGSITPTTLIDVELNLLPDAGAPIRNGTEVRFLTGTREAIARLRLLGQRSLDPGQTAMAQLSLDRELATVASEPYLIRSYSPMHTIGGGRILDVNPERHRRYDQSVTHRLETVASGDVDRVVAVRIDQAGIDGVDLARLAEELGRDVSELERATTGPEVVTLGGQRVASAAALASLQDEVLQCIGQFHEREPLKSGIDLGSLTASLDSQPDIEVLRFVLGRLEQDGKISVAADLVSLAAHDPFARLGARERELVGEIETAFLSCGVDAPSPDSIIGNARPRQAVYRLLLESGRLIRLKTYKTNTGLVLHAQALQRARQAIEQQFPYPAAFALKDVRDLLGSTRKYVVPLMEHLDATGVTVRSGDQRRLREN